MFRQIIQLMLQLLIILEMPSVYIPVFPKRGTETLLSLLKVLAIYLPLLYPYYRYPQCKDSFVQPLDNFQPHKRQLATWHSQIQSAN